MLRFPLIYPLKSPLTTVINRSSSSPISSSSYINSIQHGSVTIGNGANSNTATISAVNTSLSFIVFLGFTCSGTTNSSAIISPRIELTDSTTVTVTRNSTDTGTITVNFAVVYATSSLVDTVQSGTIATNTASGSATITAVDLTRSAVFYLGCTSSNVTASVARMYAITLSNATTVQANSNSSATGAMIGYVVVQFKAAAIQSIQQVSDAYTTANLTDTKTISAVNTGNTMIAYGGINNGGTGAYTLSLSSSTNINLVRLSTSVASRTPRYTVIEFASGVLNSAVQRGTIALANATSNTATISAVSSTKALCNFVGYQMTSTDTPNLLFSNVILTNTTTITGAVNSSSASAKFVGYEAINFN